jgi:hypothetical protein
MKAEANAKREEEEGSGGNGDGNGGGNGDSNGDGDDGSGDGGDNHSGGGGLVKGRAVKWACHFLFGSVLFFYLYHGPGWGATEGVNGQMRKGLVWSWWPQTVNGTSNAHYHFR